MSLLTHLPFMHKSPEAPSAHNVPLAPAESAWPKEDTSIGLPSAETTTTPEAPAATPTEVQVGATAVEGVLQDAAPVEAATAPTELPAPVDQTPTQPTAV